LTFARAASIFGCTSCPVPQGTMARLYDITSPIQPAEVVPATIAS
jgi:hypothetical protein